ncbi:hypothetical protein PYCCODRAFT_1436857 [Trametes coccinea BRFM310]|uniref:Uncharacterized protein n=1 Tax=Trametes coccinea (strain BRFM310) TaxID=1353009 RepID=A0A1Y2IKB4_TRAC3|nr:hypothetical protein PYCCODRAFT_1436857 [Trametes coccinea BRFM310]
MNDGGSPGGDSSDSSFSGSSDSSADEHSEGGLDHESDASLDAPRGSRGLRTHSRKKQKRHSQRYLAPVLKPEKPVPYDGRADAQVFHKFMRQMTEYLAVFRHDGLRRPPAMVDEDAVH